jgi:hypothetical protein
MTIFDNDDADHNKNHSPGITEAHLRQVRARDARSSVTGVFRIVLHRVQKQRMLMEESTGATGWGDPGGTNGALFRGSSKPPQTTPKSSPKFPKRVWGSGLASPKLWTKAKHASGDAGAACDASQTRAAAKHSIAKSTGAVKRGSGLPGLSTCIAVKSKSTDSELNEVHSRSDSRPQILTLLIHTVDSI